MCGADGIAVERKGLKSFKLILPRDKSCESEVKGVQPVLWEIVFILIVVASYVRSGRTAEGCCVIEMN